MNTPEHNEQCVLFQWAALMEGQIPALKNLYAVPNGGLRHKVVAMNLRAEGQKSGVPDVCLAYPSCGFHGMYLEMKAGRNKTTPQQNEWISRLEKAGYFCVICYSFEDAKREILAYLEVTE